MGIDPGEISDLRVAPFTRTLWDQGALLTVVSNMIWINDTVWVTTHFVTNSLGDVASASVSFTNSAGVFLITNGPGWPVNHSYGGMNAFVNVTNGPDSPVHNLISVAFAIQIIVTNQFGDILTNTVLTGGNLCQCCQRFTRHHCYRSGSGLHWNTFGRQRHEGLL